MRKGFKFIAAGLAIGILTMGSVALAANGLGSAGALADSEYTLEEMLVYAIEDEYMAQAEYAAIEEAFGVQPPVSNILRAEGNHIYQLEQLFEEYNFSIPNKDWASLVEVPESLEAAYEAGVTAEENNIAMYEKFLDQDLPDDVKLTFEYLKASSERHLFAYQNALEGNIICGTGYCGGSANASGGYGRGYGRGMMNGNGLRNGSGVRGANGTCLYY